LAARYLVLRQDGSGRSITVQINRDMPAIGVNLGRPKKEIPEEWKEIIKEEYEKFRQNAVYQEDTILHDAK